jgi:molecular chaperone GrpE (heat shock protein)
MNQAPVWTVPKWPFLAANGFLIVVAFTLIQKAGHPISETIILGVIGCVALGASLGCLPYLLEYRATGKLIEVNAVGTVAEQLADLKQYATQISAATDQWALVQETTKGNTDKTVAAAQEIAGRMADEIREFNEFQIKLNDTEKGALRLEIEKLRRNEGEWLQVVTRILDHIFALYNAASRSGNAELAEQIGQFQTACREAARRVGLLPFSAAPAEKFDAQKHRAHGVENPPADALVAETLAPGMSYQGRLLRPALVRLHEAKPPAAGPAPAAPENTPMATPQSAAPGPLALETDSD